MAIKPMTSYHKVHFQGTDAHTHTEMYWLTLWPRNTSYTNTVLTMTMCVQMQITSGADGSFILALLKFHLVPMILSCQFKKKIETLRTKLHATTSL